jgi:uroporphyrin-III C-methyltransferase/precorrin-2 dehydrogenase/sirohydrochlorin ferrochelatase
VVIYMGLAGLAEIFRQLILHGLPPSTPAAVVEQGTTAHQRVVTGTLSTLPDLASERQFKPPGLIIVGSVVSLHGRLSWFVPDARLDAVPSELREAQA